MSSDRANGSGEIIVAIALLTYKRGELLKKFLEAYSALAKPAGCKMLLIIVDNDAKQSARPVVDANASFLGPFLYVNETRKGIPVVRNRALDEALALDARILCFIDDDEYPEREWLTRLVGCWEKSKAELVGGPVEVAIPPAEANMWQRQINRSLKARMERKNRKTAKAATGGDRYTVVTNNWLLDLDWQRCHGLRFDETLLYTGGSDTAFFRTLKAAGGKHAWCPEATVYETITLDRLSLAYQFMRGAAQSKTNYRIKEKFNLARNPVGTLFVAALRLILGCILFVAPVFGIASPIIAVRAIGWAVGRVQALRGGKSRLYE